MPDEPKPPTPAAPKPRKPAAPAADDKARIDAETKAAIAAQKPRVAQPQEREAESIKRRIVGLEKDIAATEAAIKKDGNPRTVRMTHMKMNLAHFKARLAAIATT